MTNRSGERERESRSFEVVPVRTSHCLRALCWSLRPDRMSQDFAQWRMEALQTIMASWFAADFGARFVISEEGGKDFMQCPGFVEQEARNPGSRMREHRLDDSFTCQKVLLQAHQPGQGPM